MESKEKCSDCGKERASVGWCKDCESGGFKENFKNWKSGNIEIDNFIQRTQLNATGCSDYLEYIDFKQFVLIEKTNKGGAFSEIYSAIWMEGPRWIWYDDDEQYIRNGPIKVALKKYNDSQNINENYLTQIYDFHRSLNGGSVAEYFGITKDPSSSNYMFVMKYYDDSDLYSYIEERHGILDWTDIITTLWGLSTEIIRVQQIGSCYGNLHGGNVLVEDGNIRIMDIELFFQIDKKNELYKILPYMAPEILNGEPLTNSTDIYSFGIIMWILSAGIVPWCNIPHDLKVVSEICLGHRPKIIDGIPNIYTQLMKRCWDSNPLNRPTAFELHFILESWVTDLDDSNISEFNNIDENETLDLERNKLHRQGFYHKDICTSKLVDFSQLIN